MAQQISASLLIPMRTPPPGRVSRPLKIVWHGLPARAYTGWKPVPQGHARAYTGWKPVPQGHARAYTGWKPVPQGHGGLLQQAISRCEARVARAGASAARVTRPETGVAVRRCGGCRAIRQRCRPERASATKRAEEASHATEAAPQCRLCLCILPKPPFLPNSAERESPAKAEERKVAAVVTLIAESPVYGQASALASGRDPPTRSPPHNERLARIELWLK